MYVRAPMHATYTFVKLAVICTRKLSTSDNFTYLVCQHQGCDQRGPDNRGCIALKKITDLIKWSTHIDISGQQDCSLLASGIWTATGEEWERKNVRVCVEENERERKDLHTLWIGAGERERERESSRTSQWGIQTTIDTMHMNVWENWYILILK